MRSPRQGARGSLRRPTIRQALERLETRKKHFKSMHDLRVARRTSTYLFIGRVFGLPTCISTRYRDYATKPLNDRLDTPETPTTQRCYCHLFHQLPFHGRTHTSKRYNNDPQPACESARDRIPVFSTRIELIPLCSAV